LAESKKAWVALPTPYRFSWFAHRVAELKQAGQLGTISHILIRFNNTGIQRYIDLDNQWMLSKKEAGGGSLVNLGIHGFDLCRYLTGEEPTVIAAATSHSMYRQEVEDYAIVTMKTPSGILCINEASYTGTGTQHSLSSQKFNLQATTAGGEGVEIGPPTARPTVERAAAGFIPGWPGVVHDCLDRLAKGMPPSANARDGARASSLAFEAYKIAGEKGIKPA
jgi:predicted dehydrogenase